MEKKEEHYLLIPTYQTSRLTDDEFILVLVKGELRKPVILTLPKNRFERKLRYYKKLSWN